jgi:nucleotide-binding universal stress UspA family protein
VQLFGIVGGIVLLTQMGPVAIGGAVGIVAIGIAWYHLYGREKTDREGAAFDAVRRSADSQSLSQVERAFADGGDTILVAMDENTSATRERTLVGVAASVAAQQNGRVDAVRFEAVPEQLTLSSAAEISKENRSFGPTTQSLVDELPAEVSSRDIVTHNRRRAVVNYADGVDADLLLGEWEPDRLHAELLGSDVDWFMNNAPCDTVFLRDRGLGTIDDITVVTRQGPYRPLKVLLADALAVQHDARLRFVTAIEPDAPEEEVDATTAYHDDLDELCTAATTSEVVRSDDPIEGIVSVAGDADVVVVGTVAHSRIHELLLGDLATELSDRVDATVLLAHPHEMKSRSLVRGVVEKFVF